MKSLIEIAQVVTKHGVRKEEILRNSIRYARLFRTYMEGILDGRWQNDEEAEKDLYGQIGGSGKYRILKLRARKQLLDCLFFMTESSEAIDSFRNARSECQYFLTCGQTLISHSALHASVDALEHAMAIADEYNFTRQGLQISQLLESAYTFVGMDNRIPSQRRKTDAWWAMLRADIDGNRLIQNLNRIVNTTVSFSQKHISETVRLTKEMESLANEHRTKFLIQQTQYWQIYTASLKLDHQAVVDAARNSLEYYQANNKFLTRTILSTLHLQLGIGLGELRRYAEAEVQFQSALLHCETESVTWAKVVRHRIHNLLRAGDYATATSALSTVLDYARRGKSIPMWLDSIRLFHGYLTYMVKCDLFANNKKMKSVADSFDIVRFMNESKIASKDKTGLNVARIVLEVLLLLGEGNVGGVLARAESLRQYRQVYLRDPRFKRAASFLKILHLLVEYDFDITKTERKGKSYFEILYTMRGSHVGGSAGIEVIFYDDLWTIMKRHIERLLRRRVIQPVPIFTNKKQIRQRTTS